MNSFQKNILFNTLTTFGDIIPLKRSLNVDLLFKEIVGFEFKQYNSTKPHINRKALSITKSSDNDYDLESLSDINNKLGLHLAEHHFTERTEVYYKSQQIQSIISGFEDDLARSHIITHGAGGYFPPHIDAFLPQADHLCMRIFVPLTRCNVPDSYFMVDGNLHTWEHGRGYFINTNKMHHFFTYNGPASYIVLNILVNENSVRKVMEDFLLV